MRRLVADVMLAKLARWLRLSGNPVHDVPTGADDEEIIKYVRKKRALLLTLDRNLSERSKKQGFRVLPVEGNNIEEQLAFVANRLGLRISVEPAKVCPICNSRLVDIDKSKVICRLPNAAAMRHRKFYICRICGRIYWMGTHWEKIKKRLRIARKLKAKIKK